MNGEDDESAETETEGDAVADGDEPDAGVEEAVGPDVVEIEHRIGELEEDLERNGGRIESVQHSQEEVAEQVEEMNETVRDLLGVYERPTADVNPFTDGEADDAGEFGVVNGNGERAATARAETETDAGDDTPADTPDDAEVEAEAEEADAGTVQDERFPFDEADEEVFTFDDAGADAEGESESTEPTDEEPVEGPVDPTPPGDDAVESDTNGGATRRRSRDDGTPYLTTLADGYATDVLALEWLAELVETTGPAATLKALSYYEDVGWIGPEVAATLEEYLAGPGIDVHVDPNEPTELRAEDHATSYEYILKLDVIRELDHPGWDEM